MAKILYASAVGSLMYTMVVTRPEISFPMGVVSRYMRPLAKIVGKQRKVYEILQRRKGFVHLLLKAEGNFHWLYECRLCWSSDCRKFTSGYVSWISRLQQCVALSTTEQSMWLPLKYARRIYGFLFWWEILALQRYLFFILCICF